MAGGKKKKTKPPANPARGFATTSIQSKPKSEKQEEVPSESVSQIATPAVTAEATSAIPQQVPDAIKAGHERDLHELSKDELEAHLEEAELQQFVDRYAIKVRKESSRQVSRLQTDRRVLRGQSDYLSVREWLPDELMQQIVDYALEDQSLIEQKPSPVVNDELLGRIWQLRMTLLELGFDEERLVDIIGAVLQKSGPDATDGLSWGMSTSFDWHALHCHPGEGLDYDTLPQKPTRGFDMTTEDTHEQVSHGSPADSKIKSPRELGGTPSTGSISGEDIEVSDIESDVEPDELMSIYLETKAKLFEHQPETEQDARSKRKDGLQRGNPGPSPSSTGIQKLRSKLKAIESDVLFDKREAEAQWSSKKIELVRQNAERRKMQLNAENKLDKAGEIPSTNVNSDSKGVADEAEKIGQDMLDDAADSGDDDVLGGMFDSLPGVQTPSNGDGLGQSGLGNGHIVTVRNFGKITGLAPRRVLEEACKARDTRVKFTYKLVSPTTYSSRHSVTIHWSKEQDPLDADFMPEVSVISKPKSMVITTMQVATPDTAQSEAYVATAALYLIFSGSPKEEKAHLRLPASYRSLWDEFAQAKAEHNNASDRLAVKHLREQVDHIVQSSQTLNGDDDDDNEVVFNASFRRRIDGISGASTPIKRPDSAKPMPLGDIESLQKMWVEKTASALYQRMLKARMNLPMFQFKDAALETISRHQVTILCGETGCGKSTQLPAFILENELSNGRSCKIYCTEPRRISAISLAQRVSEEMGERKGDVGTARSLIGYAIRLEAHVSSETKLIYATVGIVLRMLENNDGLKDITHLVIDEVHERSIDTDFLLIVLQSVMLQRPELKVVLMSATVDAQKFSAYLGGAPIIQVPGRTFPVRSMFLEDAVEITGHTNEDASAPSADDDEEVESGGNTKGANLEQLAGYSKKTRNTLLNYDEYRIDYSLIVKLLETVAHRQDYQQFSSAVLVFLPGIAEIRQLNDMLVGHHSFPTKNWRIHPLHSSFDSADQQAAFEIPPPGVRKIVLATNIAETGITIPDVTCVIDTGKHKEMRFDERRQMSRLIQSFIARANAKQRRGRAGRVQEGICFHLFTKYRHDTLMAEQQTPEILRLSLQDLVMRVKICRLGDIEQALSQALDPPSSKNIRRAVDALVEVGALTAQEDLTPLGVQLAKLPLDAQLGKLILFSSIYRCLDFGLTVAAMLSSKSPFLSPMHAKKQADSVRLGFKRGDSDLLTAKNAYDAWRRACTTPGLSEYSFCNKNFLSPQNLAGIEDLKGQLLGSLADTGFVRLGPNERSALSKARHNSRQRSFVAVPATHCQADENDLLINSVVGWAFYPKVVKREGKGWRNVANNQSLGLHPTSVNKSSAPADIRYLSFYSVMQSSSRFTNAQETSPVTDFALTLLAGDAVFNMYAGVIIVDGNRLRLKVKNWRTMIVLKTLRMKLKEMLARMFKHPGRELGDKHQRWLEVFDSLFRRQGGLNKAARLVQ